MGGGTLARYFGWEAPREMNSRGLEAAHFQTGVDSTRVSQSVDLHLPISCSVFRKSGPSLKIKVYLNEGNNKISLDISRDVLWEPEGKAKARREEPNAWHKADLLYYTEIEKVSKSMAEKTMILFRSKRGKRPSSAHQSK